jgi:hypothetical protein
MGRARSTTARRRRQRSAGEPTDQLGTVANGNPRPIGGTWACVHCGSANSFRSGRRSSGDTTPELSRRFAAIFSAGTAGIAGLCRTAGEHLIGDCSAWEARRDSDISDMRVEADLAQLVRTWQTGWSPLAGGALGAIQARPSAGSPRTRSTRRALGSDRPGCAHGTPVPVVCDGQSDRTCRQSTQDRRHCCETDCQKPCRVEARGARR